MTAAFLVAALPLPACFIDLFRADVIKIGNFFYSIVLFASWDEIFKKHIICKTRLLFDTAFPLINKNLLFFDKNILTNALRCDILSAQKAITALKNKIFEKRN